jgi:glycosyltransferase involved in cell wall biosynthesis
VVRCFAGLISANKGVGDLVRAIALLRAQGQAVRAEIAGRGEVEHFRALAARLGVGDAVHFLGSIPNAEVVARMRAAAVVAVPSHHAYPEGLPLTIYEALSARTPLVVSDHPMFAGNLVDGQSALVHKAGDAAAMAARIGQLLGDPALYAALSAAAPAAWEALQIEAKWGAVIAHWLREDTDWLAAHSLPRCVSAGRQHCVDQRAIAAQLGGKGLARASRIACAPASA